VNEFLVCVELVNQQWRIEMRDGKLATLVCSTVTLLSAVAYAESTPKELYGKSIVLSWNETRAGEAGGLRILNRQISIYISTQGRLFHRVTVTRGNRRFGLSKGQQRLSTTAERGPGEGPSPGVKIGRTDFAGHTLIMTSQFQSGARQITVDFDSGFTSCQAKVVHGKEAGVGTIRQTSMFGGKQLELRTIEVSGVTCSVREGNVFTES
jgi:hypothetical protein